MQESSGAREGALYGLEALCDRLGRLFEPYVVQIIGKLLECFGDSAPSVRAANDGLSRSVMANLSNQGGFPCGDMGFHVKFACVRQHVAYLPDVIAH